MTSRGSSRIGELIINRACDDIRKRRNSEVAGIGQHALALQAAVMARNIPNETKASASMSRFTKVLVFYYITSLYC